MREWVYRSTRVLVRNVISYDGIYGEFLTAEVFWNGEWEPSQYLPRGWTIEWPMPLLMINKNSYRVKEPEFYLRKVRS